MPFIKAPTGDLVRVPSGLSDEEALALAKDKFPKLFADVSKAEEGFIPSLKSGFESFGAQSIAGTSDAFGMSEEQVRKMVAKSQARRMEISKAPDWEDVKKAATEYGLFGGQEENQRGGASQFLRMMRGQLGESLPAIGATMAGARIGAGLGSLTSPITGPVGPIAGGALGALAANIPMFTGSNIERQLQQQEETGVKAPIEYGAARTGAVAQASLDVASTAFVLGKLGMGKLFSDNLAKIGATAGKDAAEKALIATAERSLTGTVARGAGKGAITEMPTEIAQQVIERAQAGLDLFDDDAKKEYEATAVGAAGLGAMFGGVGGISARGQARAQQRDLEQAKAMQAELDRRAAAAKEEEDRLARLPQDQAATLQEFENTARILRDLENQSDYAAKTGNYELQAQIDKRIAAVEERLGGLETRAEELGIDPDALKSAEFGAQGIDAALAAARKEQKKASEDKSPELETINARVAKLEQMQAAARVSSEEQQRLEEEAGYVAPVPPQVLEADKLTAQQEVLAQRDLAKRQAEEQKRQQAAAAEEAKGLAGLEKIEDARLTGMGVLRVRGRTAFNEQRAAKAEEAALQSVEERSVKMATEAPFAAMLLARGVKLQDTPARRKQLDDLENAVFEGRLTPALKNLLGVEVEQNTAEEALPALRRRAEVLRQSLKNNFMGAPLAKAGKLTPAGNRFTATRAQVSVLEALIKQGEQSGLSPTEAALVGRLGALPERQPATERITQITQASTVAGERADLMFEWGNMIDALRKGEFTGQNTRENAKKAASRIAELAVQEASLRNPRLADAEKERLQRSVAEWLGRLTLNAKPTEAQEPTAFQAAVQKKLDALEQQIQAARSRGASQAEMVPLLQEDKRLRQSMSRSEIERGMTISDTRKGELATLKQGVERLIQNASGASKTRPKKQTGPFGLTQQSAAVLSRRYDKQQASAEPEAAPEPDLSGRQREMFPGSITEVTKKKEAAAKRAATVAKNKEQRDAEIKALVQKAAAEKTERQRQLTRMKQVSDFWKKIESSKKETAERVVRDRLTSLNTLKNKLETAIAAAEAEQKTERLANVKLRSLSSLGKLTNVEFSGGTQRHINNLKTQLAAVNEQIGKTEAQIAEIDKKAEEAARLAKAKTVRLPEGQVPSTEERKVSAPSAKRKVSAPSAERTLVAAAAMRERVETQERFVEAARDAIDAELARIEAQTTDFFSIFAAQKSKARGLLQELQTDYGVFKARLAGMSEQQLRREAKDNLEEAEYYTALFGQRALKNKLMRESKVLQKEKENLKVFEQELTRLQTKEESLDREQRVKGLRKRVLSLVDRVAASMQRSDAAVAAKTRQVEDVLADIAKGRIKGQRGIRTQTVPTTLTVEQEKRVAALTDQIDALGNTPADRRKRAELQQQIDTVWQGAYATVSEPFAEAKGMGFDADLTASEKAQIDADLAAVEEGQIAQSGALNIKQREEQPVERVSPAKEINRVKEQYLKILQTGDDERAQKFREKHEALFLGPLESLVRGIERREGKRAFQKLRTGIPEAAKAPGMVNDVAFRDATDADTGISTEAAAAINDRVQKALPPGIKVVYAPTLADAPEQMRKAMAASERKFAKGAVMPDGTVVVIGEAHKTTKDLEETIAHELIGHYGADVVIGADNVSKLSDRLFSNGPQHVAEVATGLGIYSDVAIAAMAVDSLKSPEAKLTFVREMIARAAEPRRVAPTFAQKVTSFIKDVIATVRNWFRNSGLSSLAKADTKEIQGIIREAERQLAAGRLGLYVSPDGNVVFRDDGVPADAPQAVKDLLSGVVSTGAKRGMDSVKANLLGVGGMTQFVDRLYPIQLAVQRGVKGGLIADLEASQAMYNVRNHGKATNHALQTMSEGPRDLRELTDKGKKYFMVEKRDYGDTPAPTLVNAFKELDKSGLTPEQYDRLFTLYLAALRVKNEGVGIEKLNYLKDKNGNPLVTAEGLAEVEKYVASKPQVSAAFNKAAEIYSEYNKGLIDFLAQSGAISKELAAELKAKKNYIPFYREKNGEYQLIIDDEKKPIRVGNLKDQPYLQALVGGDQKILSIFTTAAQNTTMLTDMALRNLATKDTAHTLAKLGMVETYEGKDKKTGAKKTMAFHKGMGPANPNVLRFKNNGEDVYIVVKTEGTAFEDIPADLLVKGMEGVKTTFPVALELLGAPAKFLRRFILLSPMYPVRQLIKDSFSVAGTSGANFVPIAGPLKQIATALTGHNKTIEKLRSQGLGSGQVLAGSTKETMDVMLRAVASGKSTPGVMLARLEAMSMLADEGVKAAGYDSFVKQGLNPLEAWLATNEIIDFNRRGLSPSVYVMNELIPFFSAAIQGLSVFGRALTGNMPMNERLKIREKFFKRGVAMAGLTMLYAAMMQDDEAYRNAPPEAKLGNVFVRIPFFDEPLRIPIPFEYGLLFKAIPEFIFSQLTNTPDADKLLNGLKNLALQSVPLTYPQVIKPIIEMQTGKDLFTERDIVPKRLQMLDASEQYTDRTTELAKMLGRTVPGISPVMVDQFIKTAGSNTLLAIASLSNVLADGVAKPETPASKTPVFGAAFQPNDAGAIISAVYEDLEEANRKLKTYESLVSKGETARADKYYNANIQVLQMGEMFGEFRNEMKSIKESEDAIRQDPQMTGVEKRKQLEDLRKLKIDVAKQYRDALRKGSST